MINRIINFSLNNKGTIALLILCLLAFGIHSLRQLPVDAVPDITNNQVQIITVTPTLATQEVEQFITRPIERAMASLPDIEEIRSTSRFALSVITIVFKDKVDIYFGRQLVDQRLKEAAELIPPGVGKPELAPVSTGLGEIYQYILHPQKGYETKYSSSDLRTMQDWIVARQIIGTPGIAEVNSFGGTVRQYEVAIDPERLRSMGVTIPDILQALEKNNENTGGAYIDKKPNAYFIRGLGILTSLDDIGKIVVKANENGAPLLIRDVATVQFGSAVRYGALTRNGQGEVVGGIVMMLKGANSAEVVAAVKEKIPTIQKSLPEGVIIEPYLDRTTLVNRSINTVEKNLLEGALIVIFILVLFLGNLRAGLIVASVIPLSMLFAIIMMNIFGITGNLMSLGAIDFGLIVDGAVIIVEAVVHKVQHLKYQDSKIVQLDKKRMDIEVKQSAGQLMSSATFGQIIILIVYIPIFSLMGIEGKMFRPMAMTVSFAIIGALILSLTYVPVMSSLFLPKNTSAKKNISERMMNQFQRLYHPVINFAIHRKFLVVTISVLLFAGSLLAFSNLGGEFIPTLEEGDFAFHSLLPGDASLTQSIENNKRVEEILMRFPEVKEVVSKTGSAEIPTDPMPPNFTDVIIILKEKDEWVTAHTREDLQDTMIKALQQIPGVFFEASQPIQMRFNELMTGVRQDLAIKIFGENMDTLVLYGDFAARVISTVKGVIAPQVEKISGLPQISIEYDRTRLSQYGLNIQDINRIIRTAFAGESAGFVYEDEKRFDLVVRSSESNRQDIQDVRNLYIPLPSGGQIPLQQIATVEFVNGPAQISREDAKRRIVIGTNVQGRDVQSVVGDIQHKLDEKVKLPAGYYYDYGGQFENLQKASSRLLIAVPVALLLIFALLYLTFHSLREALLIYSAIPMSAIGGVIALWMRDMPFSISAGVGFIALFGVAVLNGIVLISTLNALENDGQEDIYERVLEATRMRLRPVLMTAAVASLGFLPMAISTSAGAEVQKPLATVVIGGLISATALTLIVLPALYIIFKRKKLKPGLLVASLLLCYVSPSSGQELTMSLDSCIALALKNNLSLQSSALVVQDKKVLKKTAIDLGKTTIFYENEDLIKNSNDDGILKIGVGQSIQFPTNYFLQKKVANQKLQVASSEYEVSKRDIVRDVNIAYFNLAFAIRKVKLFTEQDSIFADFESSSSLRFSSGETNKVQLLSAQARHKEVVLALQSARTDLQITKQQLKLLLNSTIEIIPDSQIQKLPYNESIQPLNTHPVIDYYHSKVDAADAQKKLSYHKLLPDLNARYFNQSWYGKDDGYYGYSFGIGIPLFFWTQQGNIQSAKLQSRIAQNEFDLAVLELNKEYQKTLLELQRNKQQLDYYENTGVEQANEIFNSASIAFRNGDISQIEYSTLLAQSIEIKQNYLISLNNYNQTIIQLNYYLSK